MWKTLLIGTALVVVLGGAGVAWAKHAGYCDRGDRVQHLTERLTRKLDLNEGQQAKLQAFAEKLGALRAQRAERRGADREAVEQLLSAPQLDRDRAVELLDARLATVTGHKRELVEAFADFSDSLAPEQRERLAELISHRMNHRWGPPRWDH